MVRTRWPTGAGFLFDRFSLIVRLYFQQCQLPRRNGPPGVSIGYFQRTIVRYTWFGHDGYRALSCVADSPRPYPASNLPALYLSVRGIPVRRPALLPPASFRRTLLYHPCLQLPFASVGLGLDFARFTCHTIGHHHLAAGPCPAHIGIGTPITERPSHTTGRTGHVSGGSAGRNRHR